MKKVCVGLAIVAVLLSRSVQAEFPPCVELPRIVPYSWELIATPAEEYAMLLKEFAAVQTRFNRLFVNAKTEAHNEDAAVSFERRLQSLARRMVDVARENPKDSVSVDALVWVATHVPSAIRTEEVAGVVAVQRYQPEKIKNLYRHLAQADCPSAEQVARIAAE